MTSSPYPDANGELPTVGSGKASARSAGTALPRLIDVGALADMLGVGDRLIRRLVDERRIPFVKVGRYVRFDVDEVAQWVDENRVAQCRPALTTRRGR
jgi:excisionase family DNA binding protein